MPVKGYTTITISQEDLAILHAYRQGVGLKKNAEAFRHVFNKLTDQLGENIQLKKENETLKAEREQLIRILESVAAGGSRSRATADARAKYRAPKREEGKMGPAGFEPGSSVGFIFNPSFLASGFGHKAISAEAII